MPYPYYQNNQYYMQNMQDLQNMREKIDRQMQQMQQFNQNQMQQQPTPTNLTQNFQLAPNPTNNELEAKYVDNIEAVKNTFVIKTGIFLNKDFSTLWIKDVTGKIRTFATEEIIEMDEKDKEIYMLKRQLEEMKGMIENDNKSDNTNVDDEITKTKSSRISSSKRSNAK